MGFPTKSDHFEVFWGYHHLRKHQQMGLYWMRNYPGALARHKALNQGGKSWIEADYGKPLTKDKKELGERWIIGEVPRG